MGKSSRAIYCGVTDVLKLGGGCSQGLSGRSSPAVVEANPAAVLCITCAERGEGR